MASVIGGSSNQVGVSNPTLTGEPSMTTREAARPLRRYGGRACGRLRYRRATPSAGTRPLASL